MPPSPDVHDHQTLPPIHTRSGPGIPPSHSVPHSQQPRDPREYPTTMDQNDPAHMEYMRSHGNNRVVSGVEGRPIPLSETPIGPGVAPPSHGIPVLHASKRASGSAHDSSRQLPPLPPLPHVQHFDPSRVHSHPISHSMPSPHMHQHPSSPHGHNRSTSSSSRPRSHLGPYMTGHGQYASDTLPSVQHVIQGPSITGERDRDRSRRHDVHEHSGSHSDHHGRHSENSSYGPPAETRTSARMHTHQRAGPVTYSNRNDEHNDREFEKERDRGHDIGPDREYNNSSARTHSPPIIHRSLSAVERREYLDQPPASRLREHDGLGYTIYSRSGTPGSGSGSGSGHGAGDVAPPETRPFYDNDRVRYSLPHPDFTHEDGRRSGGEGGNGSLHERNQPSLDSRKRSRDDMDVDGENDVGEHSEEGDAGLEERGSKRFHPDSSSGNPNSVVDATRDDIAPESM